MKVISVSKSVLIQSWVGTLRDRNSEYREAHLGIKRPRYLSGCLMDSVSGMSVLGIAATIHPRCHLTLNLKHAEKWGSEWFVPTSHLHLPDEIARDFGLTTQLPQCQLKGKLVGTQRYLLWLQNQEILLEDNFTELANWVEVNLLPLADSK